MFLYRQLRLCASISAMAWLYGCAASIVPYRAPASGNTAKLFIKGQLDSAAMSRFDTFAHSEQCTEPQSLATAASGTIDAAVEMAADRPFTVRLFQQFRASRCNYIATFDPEKNHKYYLEPFDTLQACGFAIFDVTSGDRVLEKSTRKRTVINSEKASCSSEQTQTIVKQAHKPSLLELRDLLPRKDTQP